MISTKEKIYSALVIILLFGPPIIGPLIFEGDNMQHRLSADSYTYTGEPALGIKIQVLEQQIEHFKSLLEPRETGHLHTTIGVLEHRIKELEREKEIVQN
jgi:hypothetical protein